MIMLVYLRWLWITNWECSLRRWVGRRADGVLLGLQIVINRPHKRNAFTPLTVREMSLSFADARDDPAIGVIVLTGIPG